MQIHCVQSCPASSVQKWSRIIDADQQNYLQQIQHVWLLEQIAMAYCSSGIQIDKRRCFLLWRLNMDAIATLIAPPEITLLQRLIQWSRADNLAAVYEPIV
jgi:hypothetical protein